MTTIGFMLLLPPNKEVILFVSKFISGRLVSAVRVFVAEHVYVFVCMFVCVHAM